MSKWTKANPLAAVSGYKVPQGHFANGYTNGGDRVNFKVGGRVALKEGSKKNWMQDVNKSIEKRGTKGKCTPITKKGCTGRAKALAKTFKKIAATRNGGVNTQEKQIINARRSGGRRCFKKKKNLWRMEEQIQSKKWN